MNQLVKRKHIAQKKKKIHSCILHIVNFFEQQLCVFFISINSSHLYIKRQLLKQLSKNE